MKRITFQCSKCGHVWVRTLKAEPKRDPPCPNRRCEEVAERDQLKREVENLRRMLEEQRAPATIGQNIRVKAVDETARIVMEDQHLADLRDNVREGETMAPKLPQAQQQLADAMFSPRKDAVMPVIASDGRRGMSIPAARLRAVGMRAIGGAYARNSVKPTAIIPKERPPAVTIKNERYNPGRPSAEGYKK
jgi:predicted  nucleic acid-binding Zn-ribbon protein